jgi:elongation factor 2
MKYFLPIEESLIEVIILNIPSPKKSQLIRNDIIFNEKNKILNLNFDKNETLIMHIFKTIPCKIENNSTNNNFISFGRIFSGKITKFMKINVINPKETNLSEIEQPLIINENEEIESINEINCFNICGIIEKEKSIIKTVSTVTNFNSKDYLFREIKNLNPFVFKIKMEPTLPNNLLKFVDACKKLSKIDPLALIDFSDDGEYFMCCTNEIQLNNCLKLLHEKLINFAVRKSGPFCIYKETVTKQSSEIILSKSPNKHNRFFLTTEPLHEKISFDIEQKKLDIQKKI